MTITVEDLVSSYVEHNAVRPSQEFPLRQKAQQLIVDLQDDSFNSGTVYGIRQAAEVLTITLETVEPSLRFSAPGSVATLRSVEKGLLDLANTVESIH